MRLLYLVSHPIQYQAPLLRRVAAEPGIDLHVLFESMDTAKTYFDPGFGAEIRWSTPLTEGYSHEPAPSLSQVENRLKEADALWIHGWNSILKLRSLEIARRRGVPVLMRGENTLKAMPDGTGVRGVLKRAFLRWIFHRCTGFLCIGSENRAYYRAHDIDESRLFSMPYAVDNRYFRDQAAGAGEALRADLGLAAERPVVLFAGKFQARKNPGVLLDAVQRMAAGEGERPYLLFVGEGEEKAALERASAGNDDVRFLGFQNQSDLPAFYDLADVFVLPSSVEPWGLAINEAMACGTAVVTTDESGAAVDLIDGTCGAVVPAGDATALAAALREILAAPETARRMGAAAAARIDTWSFDEDLEGLKAALKAVAGPPPPT